MDEKKLARDPKQVVFAEETKKIYDELVTVGFTDKQAIEFVTSYMAKIYFYNVLLKEKKEKNQ